MRFDRPLQAAVAVQEHASCAAGVRMAVQERRQRVDDARQELDVIVQQVDVAPARLFDGEVAGSSVSEVPPIDGEMRPRKPLLNHVAASVRRGVVDDQQLEASPRTMCFDGQKAGLQHRAGVVVGDHHGHVDVRRGCGEVLERRHVPAS